VKWTQSDKTQSDSPVNHSRECATIECYTLLQYYNKEQFINVPSNSRPTSLIRSGHGG